MRQLIDKLATSVLRYLLPLTALLLPIFFLPFTTDFFVINKNLLLLVVGSLALLFWLIRNITRRRIHLSLTPATFSLILLVLIYLASSLLQSKSIYQSLMGRTAIVFALVSLFLATTSSQKNQSIINFTLGALILSAVIASLVSLYAYLGLPAMLDLPEWLKAKTFDPVGGPVPFLAFVLPLVPVTLYLALKTRSFLGRAGLLLISLLFIGASLSQIELILPGSGNQIFLLPLSAGWSIAVDIFKNARTAFLGTGPETFTNTFTRLKPIYLNNTPYWDTRFTSSSNEFFNILTTVGLLGALLWLSAFLKPLSAAFKHITAKKSSAGKLTASPTFMASFLLSVGYFLTTLIIPAGPVLMGTAVISLILLSLSQKLETDAVRDVSVNLSATPLTTSPNPYDQLSETKSKEFELLPWVFALVFVSLLVTFWFFQTRAYAANLATKKAASLLTTNATESYNQQIKAYTLEPLNPYYHINFAQTSLALANSLAGQKNLTDQDKNNITQLIQQAIRESKLATQLDLNNVLTWENLSNTYSQLINFAQGASDWAIASHTQAISLDPANPRLRLELGGVFYSLRDYDSAQRLYEQAIQLKSNWANAHYNLAVVYKTKNDLPRALAEMRIVAQLLDPNSPDYQKAQDELKQLESQVPSTNTSSTTKDSNPQNLELVTPTPLPSPKTKVTLPQESAPNIPSPTPTPTPTPTPNP